MNKHRIAFIIEQALGHITHGQNLQANVAKDPSIEAYWALPEFDVDGLAAKMPLYKSNWTVRAGWRSRRMLNQIARRTELDALFFHTQVTAVLNASWLKRIPGVVSLDATPLQYDLLGAFYSHESGPGWLEQQKWRLNRDCFRAARHIVAWTHWTKEGLVADYEVPPEKVTVIPPGVNTQEWLRPEPRRLHDGGDGNAAVKILFVGGNLERKGGTLLLDAFRTLRQKYAVELHLATRDQVAAEPGLFVYNDMQPNSAPLKQLYFESDIFCLPTFGDCLPMVLSEAGATGLPVVSTQVAGIPEIVQEGETGFLTKAGDTAALTHALETLVKNPELRLRQGECAVQTVVNGFDAERNAGRLLDLLKSVC